jgi:HAD domain in Swiss Army Knife RNA repair proteins
MKSVVLDIDGELRSWPPPCATCVNAAGRTVLSYNPEAVRAFHWLMDETQAMLVVSSTWRMLGKVRLQTVLQDWGVTVPSSSLLRQEYPKAYPGTPAWKANARAVQLHDWLELYSQRHAGHPLRMVILDDEHTTHPDTLLMQMHVEIGLTWEQARRAVAYLQGCTSRGKETRRGDTQGEAGLA